MYILVADEAGNQQKQEQSIASLLLSQEEHDQLIQSLRDQGFERELKFARVRKNDAYLQEAKLLLEHFFTGIKELDARILTIFTKSSENKFLDMYEELFLIAQSLSDDEITFTPDQNTILQRRNQGDSSKEFGIIGILEQDSKENPLVQVMDIIAGITIFLREHYGTYMIRSQSADRYEQMEEFERELHIRCELVSHFFGLLEKNYGAVMVMENGSWSVESERVVVLEY